MRWVSLRSTHPTNCSQRELSALSAHGADTLRTRPGNSVFSPDYSNPAALQELSNAVFATPGVAPTDAPFGQGQILQLPGWVILRDKDTGATFPIMIGTDANGIPTNQFLVRFDRDTGNVIQMFPVPMLGDQGPQGSNVSPGNNIVPVSDLGSSATDQGASFSPSSATDPALSAPTSVTSVPSSTSTLK
jgi:hypothetical protein